ncbi:MAG: DEAD/DEAH box helicase [Verrucomicrobiaceae bacterium]|nr:DEAD/DEAH box helicase [Verrucomicrobiaceae bacterium]
MPSITQILGTTTLPLVEDHIYPKRDAVFAQVPKEIHPVLYQSLDATYRRGLYCHQAKAIDAVLAGEDVCLATSTASGKSLVFQSIACHLALSDPKTLVIAVYPARALVQDQLVKWRGIAGPLGVRVGQIDGSVSLKERQSILDTSSVVVMTPDVVHTWLLRTAATNRANLERLRLLVLDEAHVYSGAFGTNTAYLLRRLAVLAGQHQIIASTATIGQPEKFLHHLTGRTFTMFTKIDEGSPLPEKRVVLSEVTGRQGFGKITDLLHRLVSEYEGRFLVFADSRRMVETLTRATLRLSASDHQKDEAQHTDADTPEPVAEIPGSLMPYRSGYESDDRYKIQKALADGRLRGVISTSALELGLDIGDIDLVVMVDTPPSIQAFWQRFGRAGRGGRPGECLLIDSTGTVSAQANGLSGYLSLPPEPNYLYLGNEVMQFTNALAAAQELQAVGKSESCWDRFPELPLSFREMLSNEINPVRMVPEDLFNLKQRAENGAHFEFPLRSGGEINFKVKELVGESPLGELSHAQMVREAYPGAIYLYQACPYRVRQTRLKDREILCRKEYGRSTQPITQVMVFPNMATARHRRVSDQGFLMECDVQVSEQVTGFIEKRGNTSETHNYGQGSPWWQKPVRRFLRTTGVLWHFDGFDKLPAEAVEFIIDAFTRAHAVHRRDLGFGSFQVNVSPLGQNPCKGICIYDNVAGGLRLTEKLATDIEFILRDAIEAAAHDDEALVQAQLQSCLSELERLPGMSSANVVVASDGSTSDGWVELIAPNQSAMFTDDGYAQEVEVLRYFCSPTGGMHYVLKHPKPEVVWKVQTSCVTAIYGKTRKVIYNPETGEERAI